MIAARTVTKETIRFEEVPEPGLLPGQALVRVLHVTLCGTDLHIWEDDYATELPIIQGHEFVARIEATGPGSQTRWKAGDIVAVSPMVFCGRCYACRHGRHNACRDMSVYGCYQDGALAELMSVPLDKLHAVPASVPPETAALSEPVSIALQAVRRGRPVPGERALVLGCGPIGLLATLCLADLGVEVIAADTVPERAGLAGAFGASATFLVDPGSPVSGAGQSAVLDAFTEGQGPSLVIEASGVPESLVNAVHAVASAGRVVEVGISSRQVTLPMNVLPVKELDLLGSRNSLDLLDESLELIGRHVGTVTALITHRFAFADLGGAFEKMRSRDGAVGKIAITMPAA